MQKILVGFLAAALLTTCRDALADTKTPEQRVEMALSSKVISAVEANLTLIPDGTPGREKAVAHLAALKAREAAKKKAESAPYLDATTLAERKPADIVKELQASGRWRTVKEMGNCVVADKSASDATADHRLVLAWERGKLLFVYLFLPEPIQAKPESLLALLGVTNAAPPTSAQFGGEGEPGFWEWEQGLGPFKWAEVMSMPTVGAGPKSTVELLFVTQRELERWESEGEPCRN